MDDAFQRITTELARPMSLQNWASTSPVTLFTDASDTAVSAVVVDSTTGRPIAYWSKALSATAQRWPIHERELFATVVTLRRFERALRPRHISLKGDNTYVVQALQGRCTDVSAKFARWLMYCAGFDMDVEYVKSAANPADFFSRFCVVDTAPLSDESDELLTELTQLAEHPAAAAPLVSEPAVAQEVAMAAADHGAAHDDAAPLSLFALPFSTDELISHQQADASIRLSPHKQYAQLGRLIVHRSGENIVPVLPASLLGRVLEWLHEAHGHAGMPKMLESFRRALYHKGIGPIIKRYTKECVWCMSTKPGAHGHPPIAGVRMDAPNDAWTMDYFVINGTSVLNVVDIFSNFTMACTTVDQTAATTIKALEKCCCTYGVPVRIIADNGPHFTAASMRAWCAAAGIDLRHGVPRHPQSQGRVERSNGVLKRIMAVAPLDTARYVHNFLPRRGREASAADLFLRRAAPVRLTEIQQMKSPDLLKAIEKEKEMRERMAEDFNDKKQPVAEVSVGQLVYQKNEDGKYSGPLDVREVHRTYVLAFDPQTGRSRRVHRSLAKVGNPEIPHVQPPAERRHLDAADANGPAHEEDVHVPESIIDVRQGDVPEFLTTWVGYDRDEATWQTAESLGRHANRMLFGDEE